MIFLPSAKYLYRPQTTVAPWTPLSLTNAVLYGWYKADAGVPVSTDGASVGTWYDQSGNGRTLTQATAIKQPIFRSNGVNGLPVLEIAASLANPAGFIETAFSGSTNGFSFYLVSRNLPTRLQYGGAFMVGNPGAGGLSQFCDNPIGAVTIRPQNSGVTEWGNGQAHTANYAVTKVSCGVTYDSVKYKTTYSPAKNQPGTGNTFFGLGYRIGLNYYGSVGSQIAEVIVCNRELTGDEEIKLNTYLRSRYGFDLNYGADLPVTGPALWLDASRMDTLFTDNLLTTAATTDNGPVGGWKDLSGNNRHALQTTSSARPTWRTPVNGLNGLGITSYNGSTQFFSVSNTIGWGLVYSGDFTISMVHKVSSVTGGVLLGQDNGSGAVAKWMFGYGSNGVVGAGNLGFHYNGAGSSFARVAWTPTAGQTYLITASRSGNDHCFYVDGVQVGATQVSTARPANPTVLATMGQAENAFWLGGSIAETLVYLSNLNATQLASVKSYLSSKWGTP